MKLPHDPAIPFQGKTKIQTKLKPDKTKIQKNYKYPYVYSGTIYTVGKIWKQSRRPSTDAWIKKIPHHDGILLSHKEDEMK